MFASERRLTVAVGVHSKAEASKILLREFWGTQDPKWLRSGVGARDAGYDFESYWLWLRSRRRRLRVVTSIPRLLGYFRAQIIIPHEAKHPHVRLLCSVGLCLEGMGRGCC